MEILGVDPGIHGGLAIDGRAEATLIALYGAKSS